MPDELREVYVRVTGDSSRLAVAFDYAALAAAGLDQRMQRLAAQLRVIQRNVHARELREKRLRKRRRQRTGHGYR